MKTASFTFRRIASATACIVLLGLTQAAYADDYSDVSRMLRSGQLAEASVKVDQVLSAKPNDPQIRFFKGVILSEQGKPNEAIAVFTKLTQDYPELPEPYNNLAVLYASQNQFDKARAALEMAIRTNPSYATAHENLGDIYAKLASQAYTKALQLDTSNAGLQPKLSLIKELFAPGSKAVRTAAVKTPTIAAPVAAVVPVATKAPAAVVASKPETVAPAAKTPAETSSNGVTTIKAPVVTAANTKAATSADSAKPETADSKSEDVAAVEAAVQAWARAWANKDMKAYYAAYGSDFRPANGASRSAWEADRKARIVGKRSIDVNVSNIRVKLDGSKATASFRQDYRGDALKISSNKSLGFAKAGSKWLIVREAAGN